MQVAQLCMFAGRSLLIRQVIVILLDFAIARHTTTKSTPPPPGDQRSTNEGHIFIGQVLPSLLMPWL